MSRFRTYFEVKDALAKLKRGDRLSVDDFAALESSVLTRFGRPAVGVTVVLTKRNAKFRGNKPVLCGTRVGSHGAGKIAMPGGHQDFIFELANSDFQHIRALSIAETAQAESAEETGCRITMLCEPKLAAQPIEPERGLWYQDAFVLAETEDVPKRLEREKLALVTCAQAECCCAAIGAPESDGWHWRDPANLLLDDRLFMATSEAIIAFAKELRA